VDERLDDVLRDVAAHGSSGCVHLVDAERIIAEQSPHGLPGADVFGDHVHFNFAGNYQLARAVYEQVIHILPARIRDAAPEDRPPLTKAECEERLAHTGWARYRHIKRYLELSARPPFTNQLDHAERLARLQHDLAELEPYRQPAGLRAAAATYEAAIQRDPDDYPLRMNYAILLHEGLGDSADAVKQLRALLRIVPHHAEARHDLAQNLAALGRYDEAFAEFDEALRLRPNDPTIHNNLAVALAQTGRLDDAIAHFKDALRLQPDYPAAHNNLALALVKAGRFDEAITHYNEALRLDPNYRDAQRNLVEAHIARAGELMGQQRVDKAIRDYEAAAQLEPNVPELQYNLATALARTSRMAEAVQHFREALRLRPDWPPVANNLAWILATDGDPAIRNGAEAVALAEQICPPSRCEDPALLDTLAAAYAEAGRFADAVSTARRAIEWARSDQAQQLTAEIQQRLTLYEANRPYRTAAP
jgi:tetratricopeptide (TPR) repeat protein